MTVAGRVTAEGSSPWALMAELAYGMQRLGARSVRCVQLGNASYKKWSEDMIAEPREAVQPGCMLLHLLVLITTSQA